MHVSSFDNKLEELLPFTVIMSFSKFTLTPLLALLSIKYKKYKEQ